MYLLPSPLVLLSALLSTLTSLSPLAPAVNARGCCCCIFLLRFIFFLLSSWWRCWKWEAVVIFKIIFFAAREDEEEEEEVANEDERRKEHAIFPFDRIEEDLLRFTAGKKCAFVEASVSRIYPIFSKALASEGTSSDSLPKKK